MRFACAERLAAVGLIVAGVALSAERAPTVGPVSLSRDAATAAAVPRARQEISWHGGAVAARTGEQVNVFISNSYPFTPGDVQRWVDFFAGLIHGDELGRLTAYVATPAEVASMCSHEDVLGCYAGNRLTTIGEAFEGESPEEVARHEYGHHVAANRANPPWRSVDWGAKRWASQLNVCARTAAGTAFPGDEGRRYTLNPGEAFAEAYRALNDVRLLGAAVTWPLVDSSFLPSAAGLQAIEQDVRDPWTGPTTRVVRARFTARGPQAWKLPLATPLDGTLTADLSFPAGTRYHVSLSEPGASRLLAVGAASGTTTETLSFLVCGQRSLLLNVRRQGAPGTFTVRISRP